MRACLLLCLTLASQVLAQSEDDSPPAQSEEEVPKKLSEKKPPPPPTAPDSTTAPSAPEHAPAVVAMPRPPPEQEKAMALRTAQQFFHAILDSDPRLALVYSALPFALEDKRINTPDELLAEWAKNLRQKRTDLLTIYDVQIYSPQEMEKKYGKPPARLAQFPYKDGRTLIAVANLSGHGAVALVRLTERGYRVFGYHD